MKKAFRMLALTLFVVMSIAVATIGSSAAPLVGDINGDGEVNIRDAAMILQIVTGHDVKPAEPCYHVGKVVIDEAVPVSCTADGKTAGVHCTECGDVLLAQVTIPATGHEEVTIPGKPATCTETGLTDAKFCSVCADIIAVQIIIPEKGHNEVVDEAVAPECGKTGLSEGQHCSKCDDATIEQKVVAALTHIDNDGDYICDNGCGHEFEKPAPEEPTPDTPDEPEDETCADCGKVHTNFFSEIICFFTRIINFIKNLFA